MYDLKKVILKGIRQIANFFKIRGGGPKCLIFKKVANCGIPLSIAFFKSYIYLS